MKRNYPITSHLAKAMKSDESKQRDWDKIIATLKVLGNSNYEQIADYIGWRDLNTCSRRLKELCPASTDNPKGKGLIYNTGVKNLTKRQRQAFMFAIKGTGTKENAVEVNYKTQTKTASTIASTILNSTNKDFKQADLFG